MVGSYWRTITPIIASHLFHICSSAVTIFVLFLYLRLKNEQEFASDPFSISFLGSAWVTYMGSFILNGIRLSREFPYSLWAGTWDPVVLTIPPYSYA